jgi:hypothetical protein
MRIVMNSLIAKNTSNWNINIMRSNINMKEKNIFKKYQSKKLIKFNHLNTNKQNLKSQYIISQMIWLKCKPPYHS